ncbi:hypothetical protein Tco_1335201 [Tanacetum coccineum]
MDYVKKSIEKRALHKMGYDSRVNERLMQTIEEKVDTEYSIDASFSYIEKQVARITRAVIQIRTDQECFHMTTAY